MSRQTDEIINDFAAVADRLSGIGSDWRQRQFKANDITEADNLVEGLRHLLGELRTPNTGDDA